VRGAILFFAVFAVFALFVDRMADVLLHSSPLAPGRSPVRIHYRDTGDGAPIVILHGGWGYDVYPFDRQIGALASRYRIVIPDRTGYGGSETIDTLATDFHQSAAAETRALIAALHLDRPILWGHSDGAIVALLIGLEAPDWIAGVIVEATHYLRHKPHSRPFFESVIAKPRSTFLAIHSRTWIRIVDEAPPGEDFYGGRLSELQVPALLVHGVRDPRTEPGELEMLRVALHIGADPRQSAPDTVPSRMLLLAEGGHSPHSEPATAARVTDAVMSFVDDVHRHESPDVVHVAGPARGPGDSGGSAQSK
jgi:pimeloyl-ACP methyl ester carboxylesterase